MSFQEYVKPEILVLIPTLNIIGAMMKKLWYIDNRMIPAMLGLIGIMLAIIWIVGTEGISAVGIFTAITQGILCAGAAVYANQLLKQARKTKQVK